MLRDTYGRPFTNLRIALTARCNLRCTYCHREGEKAPAKELTADEIAEILRVAGTFGIRSVKFTGGEPLLREDLPEIIAAVPPGVESSLTTNATLLADRAMQLKEAGLSRVNVSLDSLRRDRYREITGSDLLDDVLAGIRAADEAGLTPVKLNMVLLSGVNEDEVEDFLAFVRGNRNLILQLIELLEFNRCTSHGDIDRVEEDLASRSRQILTRRMHHRKKYCLDGAEVEVVRPKHNTEFCAFCNRLRVTSDGHLKPCLLRSDNHLDIRGKSGDELEALFCEAVRRREPFYR
ncbi:MAG: GTP 3',8-cyclase MoaA [Methanomicrobiales archaeon]|jgi:cyclic pyranopterin phosphate synthase|nr:GTP 3',8-cyclase MoaA [Methanomicrobiales archaeon]MDD1645859.1 GTP 3',8-cyclase MoaA [Methanomicrobiales archaeon]MDD1647733.1 GTP 3',8-cyclase MoaA [Methanomicrobiales archaeon]